MSPAEHYAEAERWLEESTRIAPVYTDEVGAALRRAQVHATLATVDPTLVGMRRPVPPVPRFEPGETS